MVGRVLQFFNVHYSWYGDIFACAYVYFILSLYMFAYLYGICVWVNVYSDLAGVYVGYLLWYLSTLFIEATSLT